MKWTGLGKIPKLRGLSEAKRRRLEPIEPLSVEAATEELIPEHMRGLVERVGQRWANAVERLQQKGIVGTIPELLVYAWLTARGIPFQFQSSMLGGRGYLGGLVPDFLLMHLTDLMIVRVQGEYWHSRTGEADRVGKARLLGLDVGGRKVVQIVDVWENDVVDRLDATMEAAIVGREIRS